LFYFWPSQSRRLSGTDVIEVADFRRSEWLAECRHPFFPLIFASDRQPFDVIEVFRVELDVLPQRTPCSTMEVMQFHKHEEPAMLFDQPLHRGQKRLVVFLNQLAGQMHFEEPAVIDFFQFH